jgi:hypothetical protein
MNYLNIAKHNNYQGFMDDYVFVCLDLLGKSNSVLLEIMMEKGNNARLVEI